MKRNSLVVLLSLLLLMIPGTAVSEVSAPSLGFLFDRENGQIRPIAGTKGASVVAAPVNVGFVIRAAVTDDARNYVLLQSTDDDAVRLLRMKSGSVDVSVLADVLSGRDLTMAVSPSGGSAVMYSAASRRLQVVTGLPDAPTVSGEVATGELGDISGLAVSDDGKAVLLMASESVYSINVDDGKLASRPGTAAAAVAFVPNRRDGVAVSRSADIYRFPADADAVLVGTIASATNVDAVGVQASADGAFIYAAFSNGLVAAVAQADGTVRTVQCQCAPTRLSRLYSPGSYRLNDSSKGPLFVVDTAESAPRLWFIPSAVAAEAGGHE